MPRRQEDRFRPLPPQFKQLASAPASPEAGAQQGSHGAVLGGLILLLVLGITAVGWQNPAHAKEASRDTAVAADHGAGDSDEEKTPDQRFLNFIFKPVVGNFPEDETRHDLGFDNFFSAGWTDGWDEPEERSDEAPRFSLLRIRRAFWEREVRMTYNYTSGADGETANEQEGELEVELPVNRRFLVEIEGAVVGVRSQGEPWHARGGDLKILPEVMLMEKRDVSFSTGLEVRVPTGGRSVGEGLTSITPFFAYWRDLGHRVGLHSYLGFEFPLGGYESDAPTAVVNYGLAPAITVTPKDTPYLGNLTFFAETNGTTATDGAEGTTITVLPGVRWLVGADVWLAVGYEHAVSGTNELNERIWASIFRDF